MKLDILNKKTGLDKDFLTPLDAISLTLTEEMKGNEIDFDNQHLPDYFKNGILEYKEYLENMFKDKAEAIIQKANPHYLGLLNKRVNEYNQLPLEERRLIPRFYRLKIDLKKIIKGEIWILRTCI